MNYSKQHKNQYVNIKRKLEKTHKSPEKWILWVITTLYVFTFGSAIFTWIDTIFLAKTIKITEPRAILQLILYFLDIYKWIQITMITLIIYGFLNTFSDQMTIFQSELSIKMQEERYTKQHMTHRGKSTNTSLKSAMTNTTAATSAYRPENNPNPEITFKRLDHGQFVKQYNKMTDKFRYVLSIFQIFITMFGIFNIIVWSLLVWTVSKATDSSDSQCEHQGIVPFYIHYATEIALYFGLWFIILYKFNRNHAEIAKYKIKFQTRVVPEDNGGIDLDKHKHIVLFLESQLGKNSPFVIFGCITPTMSKGIGLFTSFLIPMTLGIYDFVISTKIHA